MNCTVSLDTGVMDSAIMSRQISPVPGRALFSMRCYFISLYGRCFIHQLFLLLISSRHGTTVGHHVLDKEISPAAGVFFVMMR